MDIVIATAVGIVTLLTVLILVARWLGLFQSEGFAKILLCVYGVVSLGLFGWVIRSYIGPDGSSPRVDRARLVRIRQVGLFTRYDGDHGTLRLTGRSIPARDSRSEGFRVSWLDPGQEMEIRTSGSPLASYTLLTRSIGQPIRLDGRCVNVRPENWLTGQATVRVALGKRYYEVRYVPSHSANDTDKFYYNQGTAGASTVDTPQGILLVGRNIRDAGSLNTLLALRDPQNPVRQVAEGFEERWHAASSKPLEINLLSDVDRAALAGSIMFVREESGNPSSRLGLILGPYPALAGVHIYVNGRDALSATASTFPLDHAGRLRIGSGSVASFDLPKTVENGRLDFRFGIPTSFGLPKADLWPDGNLLFSSGEDPTKQPGYTFATGNPNHPFYAKAGFDSGLRNLTVQDGVTTSKLAMDQPVALGDDEQGVLVDWTLLRPSIPEAGRYAIWILAALAVAYCALVVRRFYAPEPQQIAWCIAFVAAVGILAVRLILGYRAALAPPNDAGKDLVIFVRSLPVSLTAFVLVPAAMLLTAFFAPADAAIRRKKGDRVGEFAKIGWIGLGALSWLAALVALATSAAFIGVGPVSIRSTFLVYLLDMGALACFLVTFSRASRAAPEDKKSLRSPRGIFLASGLAFGPMLLMLRPDPGSLLFLLSLGGTLLVLIPAMLSVVARGGGFFSRSIGYGLVALVLVVGVLFTERETLFSRYVRLDSQTWYYRVAAWSNVDEQLLESETDSDRVDLGTVKGIREQEWQMLQHAAYGASDQNPGYGKAPLAKVGMTYPTSLADCVFAVYILGELGRSAANATIWLYVLLGLACLYGAGAIRRGGSLGFFLPLGAGTMLLLNALYMVGANLRLLPFTGQNLPMMALYSWGDVIVGLVSLAAAGYCLASPNADGPAMDRWQDRAIPVYGVLAILSWCAVAVASGNIDPTYKRDLDLPGTVIAKSVERVNTGQLKIGADGQIDRSGAQGLLPTELEAIREFNRRANKTDASGGFYYAEPLEDGSYELRVNRTYYHISALYGRDDKLPWTGDILAAGNPAGEPRLMMLGNALTLAVGTRPSAQKVDLRSPDPVRAVGEAELIAETRQGTLAFGGVMRAMRGDKPVLLFSPKHDLDSAKPRWESLINGKPVTTRTELKEDDTLVFLDRRGATNRRFNLIYLGVKPEYLAFVRWRNGRMQRVLPGESEFPFARSIGATGDELHAKGNLQLSIDAPLQSTLQGRIHDWALRTAEAESGRTSWRERGPRWELEDPRLSKPIGFTLVDSFTGKVLSLSSFPNTDLSDPERKDQYDASGTSGKRKLLQNANLIDHKVGSTIKPLVFSTISERLRNVLPVESIRVLADPSQPHLALGTLPYVSPAGPYGQSPACDMREFISHSRTWPAVIVGSLGLVRNEESVKKILSGTGKPDIEVKGRRYALDHNRAVPPVVTEENKRKILLTTAMSQTLLFQGLRDDYGVRISGDGLTESKWVRGRSTRFLPFLKPFLTKDDADQPSDFLSMALPESVYFDCDSFVDVRKHLHTFLIGGGQCRWNNVAMAEAYARLATGTKVTTTLQSDAPPLPFLPLPKPLITPDWREKNLFEPMEAAWREGTATALRTVDKGGYRLICKTGTLGEEAGMNAPVEDEGFAFTLGKYDAVKKAFVPGQTVTGYLFMHDSNVGGQMKKFDLMKVLLPEVVKYLDTHKPPVVAAVRR